MASNVYILLGPEAGASGHEVIKEVATYEGDFLDIAQGFVTVNDNSAHNLVVAVINLQPGQSLKKK